MAKQKRNILDEMTERIDDALRELGRILQGDERNPALVPIPVRSDDDDPRRQRQQRADLYD